MEIEVSQLIPGCILTKSVFGKTSYPIIIEDTVLTDEHILILKKFLINKVEVSRTLTNGERFRPKVVSREPINDGEIKVDKNQQISFHQLYEYSVMKYKEHFNQWQNNIPINIPEIRQFLVPLIKSSMDSDIEVFKLHQYVTREDYFYHHSISVGILSAFLARRMGFEKGESIQIGLAGFLSNVGMAKIEPYIITKDSPLTYIEQEKVEKHPTYSYLLLQQVQTIKETVKLAVLQHHERLDGSGYPLGLTGHKIHQYARIVAVCDTYHAISSDRLYREIQSPFEAINELKRNQFTKFDSQVVQTFIQSFINLSLGEKIKLSNTQIGKITFIDKENFNSPLILLEDNGEIISLEDEQDISIIDFI